jgi:DnaJ-class molecular chaperone
MDNLYNILDIDITATKSEIKKAYHKLVIKYHPDKSTDPMAKEKFQEIHTAYEILSDDNKRKEYDGLTTAERMQVFDIIKVYFTEINPERSSIFNTILNTFYQNKEEEFREDINSFNVKNIFTKIVNEFITNKINKHQKNSVIPDENYNIFITLEEKYKNKPKYINIQDTEYCIPITNNKYDILHLDKVITINIICKENSQFQIINDYDLLHIKTISLSKYLYGGKIKIQHVNNESILFEFDCCLEKKPIFLMENRGLIKDLDNNRGDLYIYLTIEGINNVCGNNMASYAKTMKDTLKLMFPPLD